MNQYDDSTRGTFQTEYAKQLISFEGLRFKGRNGICNVTPTDIDGLVQLDNENCCIFFELKYSGDVPAGQRTALTKICDAINAGGMECVIFVANHNTPSTQTVIAKDAIVKGTYWHGKWYQEPKERKLHEIAMDFVNYLGKETSCHE